MTKSSIYERAMGARFERLHVAIQRFHRLTGNHTLRGEVEVEAPASWVARVLAFCINSPCKQERGSMAFELQAGADSEVWIRHFPSHTMRSELKLKDDQLVERLGWARLHFHLKEEDGELSMQLRELRFFGIACPKWLMPAVLAREHGDADRIAFRVSAALPFIGTVAAYKGHLVVFLEN